MNIYLLAFLLVTGYGSCKNTSHHEWEFNKIIKDTISNNIVDKNKKELYDLEEPDATLEMPDYLKEISGICLMPNNPNKLAANQDETGEIYFIDLVDGQIENPIHFDIGGDFEDLAWVNKDLLYVMKSNGKIYEITYPATDSQNVTIYVTPLTKETNIEGLCYDAKNNRLLLAQKGQKENEFEKNIFAFDLEKKELISQPIYSIKISDILSYINEKDNDREKWNMFLNNATDEMHFGPSAIAIHPINGQIYILSSVGKVMMVLSEKGNIKQLIKLKKNIHAQPEGMTFSTDGTLYISNEGKDSPAKLYRFRMK